MCRGAYKRVQNHSRQHFIRQVFNWPPVPLLPEKTDSFARSTKPRFLRKASQKQEGMSGNASARQAQVQCKEARAQESKTGAPLSCAANLNVGHPCTEPPSLLSHLVQ